MTCPITNPSSDVTPITIGSESARSRSITSRPAIPPTTIPASAPAAAPTRTSVTASPASAPSDARSPVACGATAVTGGRSSSGRPARRRARAVSVGVVPTRIPRASSACFFASAVPEEPEMIAPACPIVLPGGAVKPAM